MTSKERRDYSAKYIRRKKLFERQYTRPMYEALQSEIKEISEIVKSQGVQAAKNKLIGTVRFNERVGKIVRDMYTTIGVFFANQELREINASARKGVKGFGFNPEWISAIINYFQLYLLNKAVLPISETTRKQILDKLIEGEEKGWGVDQIVRELEQDEITLWRARMIVRTESQKAMFKGRELARDKSDYQLTNEWIAANDHRTRHSHRKVDGDVTEPGRPFKVPIFKGDIQVGEENMDGPGDPKASAGNVINCRCTSTSRVKFDEKGRPIKK